MSQTKRSRIPLAAALLASSAVFVLGNGLFVEFAANLLRTGGGLLEALLYAFLPLLEIGSVVLLVRRKRGAVSTGDSLGWQVAELLWYLGIVTIGLGGLLMALSVP